MRWLGRGVVVRAVGPGAGVLAAGERAEFIRKLLGCLLRASFSKKGVRRDGTRLGNAGRMGLITGLDGQPSVVGGHLST